MKLKFTRIRNFRKKTAAGSHVHGRKSYPCGTFKGLKVHKEVIPLDEEDKVCPVCGSPMERIGEEYVRRELVLLLPNVKFMNTTRKAMAALTVRKERAIRKSL